jgi:thioester reductase-like protein
VIFADSSLYEIAKHVGDQIGAIKLSDVLGAPQMGDSYLSTNIKASDVAFLFHTSGTSSGLPKSIPQTHHAAVGVLPNLSASQGQATFSTTPLYHGGIADCLRAWSSGATIHLFPGTQPITTTNILRALDQANKYADSSCTVKYFTSVPYILQMLVAEPASSEGSQGILALQQMDLVGVGGAALPTSLGDELVSKSVNLVSRYGSAECGFLLSSHREYEIDHEWSWLRSDPILQPRFYDFEPQANASTGDEPKLYEFVVKPEWPHRGKTNRPDGSFATADLFEKHPSVPNAWRYHSRADAQIVLVNGKKFDPSPIEGELLASAAGQQFIKDALIFGTGREVPGLLLIVRDSKNGINEEHLMKEVWSTIEEMNKQTQNHARISRANIVIARNQSSVALALPKSSKGTILRKQAEALFQDDIERAYGDTTGDDASHGKSLGDMSEEQISDVLSKLFDDVLGRHIETSRDLFTQGVDSIACMQLRKRISKTILDSSDTALPLNVIYDQGSIDRLSQYIFKRRNPNDAYHESEDDQSREEQRMLDLLDTYRHQIKPPRTAHSQDRKRNVVLTGATGLLGAHLLDLLLQDADVAQVTCLVRATSIGDAAERVSNSLTARGLTASGGSRESQARLACLPCELNNDRLGLMEGEWKKIADETTLIVHSAWPVNFALQLGSFESQLASLRNLLRLRDATQDSAAHFVFVSSIAAVSAASVTDAPISESLSFNPTDASPLGYSRSKWVAERICASNEVEGPRAETAGATEYSPITIIRVGQLCGNVKGAWNRTEAYPLMLSAAKITGCLPRLDEALTWLPADQAARAIIEISFDPINRKSNATTLYHVLNHHQTPTWSNTMSEIVESARCAAKEDPAKGDLKAPWAGVELVPPSSWLQRLEQALETTDHPARSLLSLWKSAYATEQQSVAPEFCNDEAQAVSETMRKVQPLSKEDVMRMWSWIDKDEQTASQT